jgi:hypothetical protein
MHYPASDNEQSLGVLDIRGAVTLPFGLVCRNCRLSYFGWDKIKLEVFFSQ